MSQPPRSDDPYRNAYNQGPPLYPRRADTQPGTYPQNPALNYQPNSTQQPAAPYSELTANLTPEDILFMRKWKQDAFYNRVLPLTAASYTCLYYFTKSKGLPQKWARYLGLGLASYFVGILSYRKELQRRVQESNLNTPFMLKAKKAMGFSPSVEFSSDFDTLPSLANSNPNLNTGDFSYDDSWKSGGEFVPDNHYREPSSSNYPGASPYSDATQYGYSQQPSRSNIDSEDAPLDPNKPAPLTYDELRAKNRGFVR